MGSQGSAGHFSLGVSSCSCSQWQGLESSEDTQDGALTWLVIDAGSSAGPSARCLHTCGFFINLDFIQHEVSMVAEFQEGELQDRGSDQRTEEVEALSLLRPEPRNQNQVTAPYPIGQSSQIARPPRLQGSGRDIDSTSQSRNVKEFVAIFNLLLRVYFWSNLTNISGTNFILCFLILLNRFDKFCIQ